MYEEIRVKNVLDAIYKESGRIEVARGSHNDPNSKSSLELKARRRAFTSMAMSDRKIIDEAVDTMIQKTGMQKDALLGILMHIGIFLNACDGRKR